MHVLRMKSFALLLLPALAFGSVGCGEVAQGLATAGGAALGGALIYKTVQDARASGTEADIKDVQLEKHRIELDALKENRATQP